MSLFEIYAKFASLNQNIRNKSVHTFLNTPITNYLQNKEYTLIKNILLKNEELLKELMESYFTPKWKYIQHFSNVLEEFKKENQEHIQPFFPKWLELLEHPFSNAFQRNSYRYFQDVFIPESQEGTLYDLAYETMLKLDSPIAIKVFAMTTCYNIAKNYPELLPELREAILSILELTESAGVKSRANKLVNLIDKKR